MDLRDYQYRATRQGLASIKFFKFCAIGLEQEVKEINAKAKRLETLDDVNLNKLQEQLGDCLWFITNLAQAVDLSLEEVVAESLEMNNSETVERVAPAPAPAPEPRASKRKKPAVEEVSEIDDVPPWEED
ncbi:MAG: hypothetical protein HC835_20870 [Oscillatoriales cyanobacterium RM2_1_1]|nr:hypothetical protein [Oscillatoriales cyanobacterium RM2_1_1]